MNFKEYLRMRDHLLYGEWRNCWRVWNLTECPETGGVATITLPNRGTTDYITTATT